MFNSISTVRLRNVRCDSVEAIEAQPSSFRNVVSLSEANAGEMATLVRQQSRYLSNEQGSNSALVALPFSSSLVELKIGKGCYNEVKEVDCSAYPQLVRIEIGDRSLIHCTLLKCDGLQCLKDVVVGRKCFCFVHDEEEESEDHYFDGYENAREGGDNDDDGYDDDGYDDDGYDDDGYDNDGYDNDGYDHDSYDDDGYDDIYDDDDYDSYEDDYDEEYDDFEGHHERDILTYKEEMNALEARLILANCPSLRSLSVGPSSFMTYKSCEILRPSPRSSSRLDCPALQDVFFGENAFQYSSALTIAGLSAASPSRIDCADLYTLDCGNSAFAEVEKVTLSGLASLVSFHMHNNALQGCDLMREENELVLEGDRGVFFSHVEIPAVEEITGIGQNLVYFSTLTVSSWLSFLS